MNARLVRGLSGAALVAGFFSLRSLSDGARVRFVTPWDRVAPEEASYWLGACVLLLPGAALLGAATAPLWSSTWQWLGKRLDELGPRQRLQLAGLVAVVATTIAQLGNALVFHGLPFTDDEYAALFGGQGWALGLPHLPVPDWMAAAPQLFLFARAGQLASIDFPGVICAWALSEWTGSGTWIFSLLGGVGTAGLVAAAARRWGPRFGALALLLALTSPHFGLLSASSHAHVLSRGFLAAALGVLLFVDAPSAGRGALGGLLLGLGWFTRPLEVSLLAGPWALGLLLDAARARRFGFVGGFVAAGLLPVGLLVGFDWATAHSVLPARFLPNDIVHPYLDVFRGVFDFTAWPDRLGNNLFYNLTMCALFLLGPIGLPLAVLGARTDRTHHRLALGVGLAFALALLHDDRGIHALGPVHYSEVSAVLLLLALAGLRALFSWLGQTGIPLGWARGALAGYLVVGLTIFTLGYARAISQSNALQREVYALLETGQPAVVLAPPYTTVAHRVDTRPVGRWVFSWRRVRPGATEPSVVLHDSAQAREQVGRWFPGREVFVLQPRGEEPSWMLVPLHEAKAPPPDKRAWVELRPK